MDVYDLIVWAIFGAVVVGAVVGIVQAVRAYRQHPAEERQGVRLKGIAVVAGVMQAAGLAFWSGFGVFIGAMVIAIPVGAISGSSDGEGDHRGAYNRTHTSSDEPSIYDGGPSIYTKRPSIYDTGGGCDPSYPDECLKSSVSDYDCAGGTGDGPRFAYGPVTVEGSDPYALDSNDDGVGCE